MHVRQDIGLVERHDINVEHCKEELVQVQLYNIIDGKAIYRLTPFRSVRIQELVYNRLNCQSPINN